MGHSLITKPTASFAALSGNQPTSLLDAEFDGAYNALNNPNQYNNGYADTGSVNAVVITTPAFPAFSILQFITFQVLIANTNTGASTLNINATGGQPIVNASGNALVGGELVAGRIVEFINKGGFQFQILSATPITSSTVTQPTRSILTAASGTYTVPAGVKSLYYRFSGPGGGGSGSGTGAGNGNNGATSSSFGSFQASAGLGGATTAGTGLGGAGGTPTIGNGFPGGTGQSGSTLGRTGGQGGCNPFGGAGAGGPGGSLVGAGGNGATNSGAGGGGAGGDGAASGGAAGGGAGGYVEGWLTSLATTYSYVNGVGGVGGTAGTSGAAGGAGANGQIIVDEFYI